MKNLKKIELHLHLDGSVNPKLLYKLSKSKLPYKDFIREITTNDTCQSLDEYLDKFNSPLSIMQTKNNLTKVAHQLAKDLKKDNVVYAEIRFSPILHTKENLSFDEIITSILKGLRKSNLKTNLILCCMRGFSKTDNLRVVESAKKYLNNGVCAIDLAGSETKYPNELYDYIFEECQKYNIPYTIHAGEASGKKSIISALDYGTKRLGHGINIQNDEALIKRIKDNNIALEICPTSNINTKVIDKIEYHPIYKYYKLGVLTTINTDNRTISNTTLTKEYELLSKTFGLTKEDFKKMNRNSLSASFLTNKEKEKISKVIE